MTLTIGGAAAVIAGLIFLSRLPHFRQHVRPIYVKMGIISETASIPKAAADEDIAPE